MIITKEITRERLKKEPYIKEFFKNSFPKEERLPMSLLLRRVKTSKAKFNSYYENNEFIGLSYFIPSGEDKTYILYIAVNDKARGNGYGTTIINLIKEQCKGQRIFLSVDEVSDRYEDYEVRRKRQQFYEKNGFMINDYTTTDFGMIFNIMSYNGSVSKEEYMELVRILAGRILSIFYK